MLRRDIMYVCGGILFECFEEAQYHMEWVFAHEGIILGIELVECSGKNY
jgi:hypothetical protein